MSNFLRINFDKRAAMAAMTDIEREQFPFALASGLTMTALQIKTKEQKETRERFKLHTDWIPRNIRIKAARKSDVVRYGIAEAWIYTTKQIAFMSIHEKGGPKPIQGRALALPSAGLKEQDYKTSRGAIKGNLKPKSLLRRWNAAQSKPAKRTRKGPKAKPMPFIKNDMILLDAGEGNRVKILYMFRPKAEIKPRWDFEGTARHELDANFRLNFGVALARAVATANAKGK